jgi:hypothetical protein
MLFKDTSTFTICQSFRINEEELLKAIFKLSHQGAIQLMVGKTQSML